jgi:hypothetical protein
MESEDKDTKMEVNCNTFPCTLKLWGNVRGENDRM